MKNLQDWHKVNKLYKEGMPKKAIARKLKISKNTVKKLLKLQEPPEYKRDYYPTKIDSFKDQIRVWYLDPKYDFIGTRIYSELKQLGYCGSINPIYRYLNVLNEEKSEIISKKATVRIETPYGDQAQFDWSEYKVEISNNLWKVYCLSIILSASRKKAMVFSTSVDSDSILEAIQELFYDLGGITKELLIDNPKTLVIQNVSGKEVVFNDSALKLSMHMGFDFNPCKPYRARTKGKIEKPYQYIEEHFIKGNSFESMEELNKKAKFFINEWNKKIHGTTKRTPDSMFEEEKLYLIHLPKTKYFNKSLCTRKVSLDSLVSFESNKYSVPAIYADKQVFVRKIYGYRLDIYSKGLEFIISYEIAEGKGKTSVKEEHYAKIATKVPKSIPEIKRTFMNSFKNGSIYIKEAEKVLNQPSFHIREILKLRDCYELSDLDKVLKYCILEGVYDIEGIKSILKEKFIEIVINDEVIVNQTKVNIINSDLVRQTSYYEGGQF
ncbi:transposase [Acetoanaerobium pronyense]|uniref:Transposase n=1 Tax=Acetoanaerobium pronyense TaxID=1482736 RepID=A0ABS4KR24_9FIRM|nr:transposase [Acetoanaerobium pronyense]